MNVISTRGAEAVPLSAAITTGQAPDGGLYMPQSIAMQDGPWGSSLPERTTNALQPFFAGDTLAPHLAAIVAESLSFEAPTRWLNDDTALLELFWGPTAAFKDFGARFLASCLTRLFEPAANHTVLVATSGDTGAAVAAAFHRKPGIRVAVLYPDGRVSPRQAHQLGAFGDNVATYRVAGTFDDCQRLVKAAFSDEALTKQHGLVSANSISLGRLLPQMSYYVNASLTAEAQGRQANFVIPTGNLGNAFACLLTRESGLPIGKVVLASNENRVLPDFLASGKYEPRASIATLANAMDVGAPSNLERLRHHFSNPADIVRADWVSDEDIRATIQSTFTHTGEIVCPHTACGLAVRERLRSAGEGGDWIVAATAHAAKFAEVVEPLVGQPVAVPPALQELLDRATHAEPLAPTLDALSAALAAD
ncbi:MAG TPA: threonine synthase [Planctomycetes bacterium]|nr:threonine synthase [Planctomycetota bacterium]